MSDPIASAGLRITATSDGLIFAVRATPRAKRNAVAGSVGNSLKVYVTAPPEDGRANEAVVEVLADWLGIKRRQVEIITGASNRNKIVRISGISRETLLERLVATAQ